jgi:glycosyltransferase involved in cell wall biosynthesis
MAEIKECICLGDSAVTVQTDDEKRAIYQKTFDYLSTNLKSIIQDAKYPDLVAWLSYVMNQIPPSSQSEKQVGINIAIFGYENKHVPDWDPSSIYKGIGGSEEAVIYASQELVKLGHKVIVFMQPPKDSIYSLPYSNPLYLPASLYSSFSTLFDYTLCWRHTKFAEAKEKAKQVWFWSHDIFETKVSFSQCDGIFFLTDFHRISALKVIPQLEFLPYCIAGNGVNEVEFNITKEKKKPLSCIYASNYSRGLTNLIDVWPDILKEYPKAKLDVYFGKNTYGCMPESDVEKLCSRMKELKIEEHGMVGHDELYSAMKSSSLWVYPYTGTSETFCIIAVKTQRAGCIPVVVRKDALKETVAKESFYIKEYDKEEYTKTLLSALKFSQTCDMKQRDIFITHSKQWTWKSVVETWIEMWNQYGVTKTETRQ